MSETTLIHINNNIVGQGLLYANGEKAWLNINNDSISSACEQSSAIGYWKYNFVTKNFTVKYKLSNNFYIYEGVPYSIIIEMMFADSLGAFIAKRIKPNYSVNA